VLASDRMRTGMPAGKVVALAPVRMAANRCGRLRAAVGGNPE